jgi:mxaJ protein
MRIFPFALLFLALGADAKAPPVLRVCADPNALPFSNARGEGFENRLARMIAHDLGAQLEYTWWAQRRGFVRNTLKAGKCDVVMGVPADLGMVQATTPYYRSSYAFVTRADRDLDIRSLDDPRLATLRIGVPLVGDDGANPPPVHALARRGIVDNVVGYMVYGDYAKDSPIEDLPRAVAAGDVDVGIAWGPVAGAFANTSPVPLRVTPIAEAEDAGLPMAFDIAMGVRHGDDATARTLDLELDRRHAEITAILRDAGVP